MGCPGGGGQSSTTEMTEGTTGMTSTTNPTPNPMSSTTMEGTSSTTVSADSTSTGGTSSTGGSSSSGSSSSSGGSSSSEGGLPTPACADADLGTMVGNNLLSGMNAGAGDDVPLECFGGGFIASSGDSFIDPSATTAVFIDPGTTTGGFIEPPPTSTGGFIDPTTTGGFIDPTTGGFEAEDYLVAWTAPNAGMYSISLEGSSYDTVLGILSECEGRQLDCNDDCFDLQSGITVTMEAGQQIILVIEGFAGKTGMFNININPGMANCIF